MTLILTDKKITPFPGQRYSEKARKFIERSRAKNTVRAYKSDWRDFEFWCKSQGRLPLPASTDTVIEYMVVLSEGLKANSIARRLTAINAAHMAAEVDSPTKQEDVRLVMQGIRRTKGTYQHGKAALKFQDLDDILLAWDNSLIGIRNKAIILLGFAGAFRRSELVSLDVADLVFSDEGIRIFLGKAKNDPEGKGMYKGINYLHSFKWKCPVKTVKAWLEASRIVAGPLFRPITKKGVLRDQRLSDRAVANITKEYAKRTGKNPADYAGHSLRRGLITSAADAGASEREIMKQSGHRTASMVRRYIEDNQVFSNNGLDRLGKKER